MAAPRRGVASEAPRKRGKQPRVIHELGAYDCNTLLLERDPAKVIAIGAVIGQVGQFEEHGRRQKAGFGQPGTGAVRLYDMPHTRIARVKTRRSIAQAIPSTSIIE
jgi:hypothetical protein